MPLLGDDRFARIKFALIGIKFTGALNDELKNNLTLSHLFTFVHFYPQINLSP